MAENIFKWLRLHRTNETVMRGEGKQILVDKPFSGTRLAKEMGISQATLDNAENGKYVSLKVIEKYHDYFNVPYSTLLGETNTLNIGNVHINKKLGLTDNGISTIKNLSDISLSMLNAFVGKQEKTDLFFYNLSDIIFQ